MVLTALAIPWRGSQTCLLSPSTPRTEEKRNMEISVSQLLSFSHAHFPHFSYAVIFIVYASSTYPKRKISSKGILVEFKLYMHNIICTVRYCRTYIMQSIQFSSPLYRPVHLASYSSKLSYYRSTQDILFLSLSLSLSLRLSPSLSLSMSLSLSWVHRSLTNIQRFSGWLSKTCQLYTCVEYDSKSLDNQPENYSLSQCQGMEWSAQLTTPTKQVVVHITTNIIVQFMTY